MKVSGNVHASSCVEEVSARKADDDCDGCSDEVEGEGLNADASEFADVSDGCCAGYERSEHQRDNEHHQESQEDFSDHVNEGHNVSAHDWRGRDDGAESEPKDYAEKEAYGDFPQEAQTFTCCHNIISSSLLTKILG